MKKIYDNLNIREAKFESGSSLIEAIKDSNNAKAGFDVLKRRISPNMIEETGVVDPVKVVKSALRYGAGLASILLTAECAVLDEKYDFVSRIHDQIRI
jgi:chaperonin GroEL (HSP60 family)